MKLRTAINMLITTTVWIAIYELERLLNRRSQRPFYLASTLNAAYAAALGLVIAVNPPSEAVVRSWNVVPVMYYITDFVRTPSMRVHHLATLAIYQWTPYIPKFVAALMLLDLPIPLLNYAMWLRPTGIPTWLKFLVTASYFITRLVWYPLQLARASGAILEWPVMMVPYLVLIILNAKWFARIVSK